MNQQLIVWAAIVAIVIAAFYLIRSVILWYFKIDERIELMRQQNQLLMAIVDQLSRLGKVNG